MPKQTSHSKQRTQNAASKQNAGSGGNKQSTQKGANGQSARPQGKLSTRRNTQQAAKQQKQQQLQQDRRSGRITLFSFLGVGIIIIAAIVGVVLFNRNQPVNAAYPAVDSIKCDTQEQLAYHIHAHLSISINGSASSIPANIGIAADSSCFYWMHTHDTTGVLHIESPTQKIYTIGNFFDEWSQQFSSLGYPTELSLTTGWQVWVNGKVYSGDYRNIQLNSHTLVTMAFNSPGVKPDTTYPWNGL